MKILILDPEKNVTHRISKDTSGGYGTGNDFGDSIVPRFLKKTLKKVHDWPPMFAVYSISVLKNNGHEVHYSKNLPNDINSFELYASPRCLEETKTRTILSPGKSRPTR